MTYEEAVALVNRYNFGGPMPIKLKVSRTPGDLDRLEVQAELRTKHRVTYEATYVYSVAFLPSVKASQEKYLHRVVRDLVRQIWDHEGREWFTFDGALVDDPHKLDPK